jgi:hypothetical protein
MGPLNVRAKARTYLRDKCKSKGKAFPCAMTNKKSNGRGKGRGRGRGKSKSRSLRDDKQKGKKKQKQKQKQKQERILPVRGRMTTKWVGDVGGLFGEVVGLFVEVHAV